MLLANRRSEATEDANNESFSWTILDAITAAKSAWRKVSATTIQNCYRTAGFVHLENTTDSNDRENPAEENTEAEGVQTEENLFRNVWDSLRSVYGDRMCDMSDYVGVDTQTETSSALSDEDIVQSISTPTEDATDEPQDSRKDQDPEDEEEPAVKRHDVYQALRTIRRYAVNIEN